MNITNAKTTLPKDDLTWTIDTDIEFKYNCPPLDFSKATALDETEIRKILVHLSLLNL